MTMATRKMRKRSESLILSDAKRVRFYLILISLRLLSQVSLSPCVFSIWRAVLKLTMNEGKAQFFRYEYKISVNKLEIEDETIAAGFEIEW